jgi:group II intron reverse transcriptase/maturase
MMNEPGKSDRSVVPQRPANQRESPEAKSFWDLWERVQGGQSLDKGRDLAKEKAEPATQVDRTQSRVGSNPEDLSQALERIRQAARRDKELKFTSLWHHVYQVDRLREAYLGLKRHAAPGEDQVTWQEYGQDLEANLRRLGERLAGGAYRATPVRRIYIPKADGRKRPIGIPVLEDKIVQRATVQVLNAVYESDFLGFSYGFRPGRSQHNALDALTVAIQRKRVNYVLDADIRSFFDTLDHECLIRIIEHRIADPRVIRHVRKWLNAGVLEQGQWQEQEEGVPQGGSVSPLLANIYLHHVLDLWTQQWRRRQARGDMCIVRYADDFVVGFQNLSEARRYQAELKERFGKFGLELHPEKTRILEFGRYASERRKKRGEGKPATFDFLGFTHCCAKTDKGTFRVLRLTMGKRLRAKLKQVKTELRRRMHQSTAEVGNWLASVVTGHHRYYGVPGNDRRMRTFNYRVFGHWWSALNRRSQKGRISLERMTRIANRWLPPPRKHHPYPAERLIV